MTTLRELVAKVVFHTEGVEKLDEISEHVEGIHRKIEMLAGYELAKGLYELTERFSGVASGIEASAMSAGLTTDKFQELAYAASQNAVSQEELGGALSRFNRILGSARDGSKEANAQFAKVGISRDQILGFGDAGDALEALADHVESIQDPIKRSQAVMQLLGRGSAKMTKMLAQGGAGIRDKMSEAVRINAIASHKNIENLAELEDTVSSLGSVFKAVAINLTGYFAPAITAAVDRVKKFWIANHAIIEEDFKKWAVKAAFALAYIIGFMQKAGEDIMAFAEKHQKLVDAIEKVVASFIAFKIATGVTSEAVGAVLGPFKQIAEVFSVIKGIWDVAKFAGPIISEWGGVIVEFLVGLAEAITGLTGAGAVAAVALLGVALHDLYVWMSGQPVENLWLYKLIMLIKSLSLGTLKKLGLYDPDKDAMDAAKNQAMAMELAPIGQENQGGRPWDFSSSARYRTTDIMDSIGDLSHAQNVPPTSLARLPAGADAGPVTYNVEAPITVNVPANADPKAMAEAAKSGVADHLNGVLQDAHTNQKTALVY